MKIPFFTFLLLVNSLLIAQSDFEGVITSTITYENMNDQMKAMKSMLPSESKTEIRNDIAKTTTPTGMMGETIIYSNIKTSEILMLQDIMGNKVAIRMNKEEVEKEQEKNESLVEYTNETKDILGYKCQKAIVKTKDAETEIYFTKELPNISVNGQQNGIQGFPMQTIVSTDLFTVISTVSEIKKEKVNLLKIEIPTGYKEMSKDEFQKSMGMGM